MKRIKTISIAAVLFVFCLSLFLGGCSMPNKQAPSAAGGYEVRDAQGYVLKLPQKPHKIVPLTLATDEILVGMLPFDRIAALTYLADDPGISNITEQAKQIPVKVRANPEQIIAMQPDLVIIADWQPAEVVQTMRDAGLAVYVYKTPKTIVEIKDVIAQVGKVVGEEEAAANLIAAMDKELADIRNRVSGIPEDQRKTVVWFTLMGGSGGKGSLFDDICSHAGVISGAAKAGLGAREVLSKEKIVEINPDVFILPTWDYTGKTDLYQYKQDVQNDPAFQSVRAVQQRQLYMVADRKINCSSQNIVYGVRDIASAAYPERF